MNDEKMQETLKRLEQIIQKYKVVGIEQTDINNNDISEEKQPETNGARQWDFGRGEPVIPMNMSKQEKPKTGIFTRFYVRCWLGVMKPFAIIIRGIMLHCLNILHIDPNSIPKDKDLETLCADLQVVMNTADNSQSINSNVDGTNNIDDPLELPIVRQTMRFIGIKTPKPSQHKLQTKKRSIPKQTKKAAKTTRKKK